MAYVNNIELNEAILDSHLMGGLTSDAYKLFKALIRHRINKLVHRDRELKYDEIETKCMTKIERVWQNFKFDRSNAYAYFVSVVDNTIKRWFLDNNVIMLRIDENISDFSH